MTKAYRYTIQSNCNNVCTLNQCFCTYFLILSNLMGRSLGTIQSVPPP